MDGGQVGNYTARTSHRTPVSSMADIALAVDDQGASPAHTVVVGGRRSCRNVAIVALVQPIPYGRMREILTVGGLPRRDPVGDR